MTNIMLRQVSVQDLCESAGLEREILLEVIAHGIAAPLSGNNDRTWVFDISVVNVVRKAGRLHRDLGIDWQSMALVLELLEQRDQLQAENVRLRQRLSRFID